jgi:hypothetical protein
LYMQCSMLNGMRVAVCCNHLDLGQVRMKLQVEELEMKSCLAPKGMDNSLEI